MAAAGNDDHAPLNLLSALTNQGHRAFGASQSWSTTSAGIGGERLIADLLAKQVNALSGGSAVFVGIDLGKAGAIYPHVPADDRCPLKGFGGDVDIALFLREYQAESERYGASRRGLHQDHLVLIDSKQYAGDWNRDVQFDKAVRLLGWMRETLAHPRLLGAGNGVSDLRISYHFAHTGSWVPTSWLRNVGGPAAQEVSPGFDWWNRAEDLVLESPAEVLLGQLMVLLTFAHPDYRPWVPEALWKMLAPSDRRTYDFGPMPQS